MASNILSPLNHGLVKEIHKLLPRLPLSREALLLLFPALLVSTYGVYKDYQAFLSLGVGGTPKTFVGYLRITFLRLFALRNPYDTASLPAISHPKSGYLITHHHSKLPQRAGPRPKVAGIAPQRQTTQRAQADVFTSLSDQIKSLAAAHPNLLRLGTSCFEKHGPGLFSRRPVRPTCKGEICHAHPSDGSLHLTLHPDDARIVLERGWGQRHPLARGGWLARFVPASFVMIYAPRDQAELEFIMLIIQAAIWWVNGTALERSTPTSITSIPTTTATGEDNVA